MLIRAIRSFVVLSGLFVLGCAPSSTVNSDGGVAGQTVNDASSGAGGGVNGSGGASGSGGAIGSGGKAVGSGGVTGSGGTPGSGGKATGSGGAPGSGGAAGGPAGWNLVWSDEFDGPAGNAANAANWTYDTGASGWGNNELEYYRSGNANAALDGKGNLVITAKKESYGGASYTSARLKTLGLRSWTYGRIEGRMKLPGTQGIWPAFWMMGIDINTTNWPGCGELDIMENLGREPSIVHGTFHGPGYSGAAGPTASYTLPGGAKFADAFHVFAIEWETNVVRWYLDGTLYSTKTPADIGAGNTWVFNHPFFILLNVAVGGGWPGNPDGTTVLPQTMVIDYIRVYQR